MVSSNGLREKPHGGFRICVDLTSLNKYVKRPIHPGPSPIDVVSDIPPRKTYFTTMDTLKGYWQIPLSEKARPLTTFTQLGFGTCFVELRWV